MAPCRSAFLVPLLILFLVLLAGLLAPAARPEPEPRPALALQVGHTGAVLSAAFSPDGRVLATGGADGTVKLWDARAGGVLATLAMSVAFAGDGKRVVGASGSSGLCVWDAKTGRLLATLQRLPSPGEEPEWIAYTPDGYYDASPGAAGLIRWRVGDVLFAADRYAERFHRPDLVAAALRGAR